MRQYLIVALLAAFWVAPVMASQEDDLTSLSYISYLERYATVQPASQDENLEALINMPLVGGDRLDTAREARVEVQLADGSTVWLDEYSSLSLDTIAFSRDSRSDRTVLFLASGQLMAEIPPDALGEHASRVDSPSASIHLNRGGLYRVSALERGGLRVEVLAGLAETSLASGGVQVAAGSAAEIRGAEITTSTLAVAPDDAFAQWVAQRSQPPVGESATRVDERYGRQASQLDSYGNWLYVDTYNTWAWRPSVGVGWQPYTLGNWYWTPAGWSWLSYEPWGWLPYHYGNWWHDASFGWLWSWGSSWSPAWVHWMYWPGYVGWCPAGYYNYWYWGNYGYWYGWHDRYYPRHPGGGGGNPYPPRGDVQPPRPGGRAMPGVADGRPVGPNRVALDFNGRANPSRVDPGGWNVVRSEDFASPNLSRLVKPGAVALPNARVTDAVVSSRPLVTDSPRRQAPGVALDRAFAGADRNRATDLTPVLARDSGLEPTRALQLVEPTTPSRLASGSSPLPGTLRSPAETGVRPAPAATGTTAADAGRQTRPNIHRSTLATDGAPALDGGRWTGSRPTQSTSPSSRGVVRTSPGATSTSGGDRTPVVPPTVRRTSPPAGRTTTTPGVRSVPPSTRGSSRPSGPVTGSRPVIVPNTSPSRPSRQIVPRASAPRSGSVSPGSGSRSAPSVRAPSSSGGSRPSSAAPSRSSGSSGGARSSSGSSGSTGRSTSRGTGSKG